MKYKNKPKVDELCKEIEDLTEMHNKVMEADHVDMKYGPDTNFRTRFEDLEAGDIDSLFNESAIVFKSSVLTHISDRIASLKRELEKL